MKKSRKAASKRKAKKPQPERRINQKKKDWNYIEEPPQSEYDFTTDEDS